MVVVVEQFLVVLIIDFDDVCVVLYNYIIVFFELLFGCFDLKQIEVMVEVLKELFGVFVGVFVFIEKFK